MPSLFCGIIAVSWFFTAEDLSKIPHTWNLSYGICSVIYPHSQTKSCSLHLCLQTILIFTSKWIKKLIIWSVSKPIMISMLVLLECIGSLLLLSFNNMNVIFAVSWVFQAPDVLRSYIISRKYSLILLRYCPIDSFLPLSHLCLIYLSSKVSTAFFAL